MELRKFGPLETHVPIIGQGTWYEGSEAAAAGDLRLSDSEMAEIDVTFPLGPRPNKLPML